MDSIRQASSKAEGDDPTERIAHALSLLRRPRRHGAGDKGGDRETPDSRPFGGRGFPGGPFGTGAFGRNPFGNTPWRHRDGREGESGGGGSEASQADHEADNRTRPHVSRAHHWAREAHAPGGPARFRLLEALELQPLTITEIGDRIGVDQPRASRLVAFTERAGLVMKRPDPADARRILVEITSTGNRMLAEIRSGRKDAIARGLAGFSQEEAARFAELLTRFAEAWSASESP